MTQLNAFHGSQEVKDKYVNRIKAHRAAEHLMQGVGFTTICNGKFDCVKGCAVGCTLDNYNHRQYPVELGLPVWLAYLEDTLFEGLNKYDAEQFAVDFLTVIPTGADVSDVRRLLAIERQKFSLSRLEGNSEKYAKQCRNIIKDIIFWHENGEPVLAVKALHHSILRSYGSLDLFMSKAISTGCSLSKNKIYSAAKSMSSVEYSLMTTTIEVSSSASCIRAAQSCFYLEHSSVAEQEYYKWEAKNLLELLAKAPIIKENSETL